MQSTTRQLVTRSCGAERVGLIGVSVVSGIRDSERYVNENVAKPRIRLDRNVVCELLLPSGTYVQSFVSIAPAVTKRAVLSGKV
jgi:hypothetical protein